MQVSDIEHTTSKIELIEQTTWQAWIAKKGSGKTTMLTDWLLKWAASHPGRKFYATYPVYDGSGFKDPQHYHPQFEPLVNLEQIRDLRQTAVGLDELGSKYVPAHEWASPQSQLYSTIASNCRKHEVSLGITDQYKNKIDHLFRINVDTWHEPVYNPQAPSIDAYVYDTQEAFEAGRPNEIAWLLTDGRKYQWYNHPATKRIVEAIPSVWIAGKEFETVRLGPERIKFLQKSFSTKQIIPQIPRFQLEEQAEKVKVFLAKNGKETTKQNLAWYQVKTDSQFTQRQVDALLVELSP